MAEEEVSRDIFGDFFCRLLVCLTKENVQPAPWKSMMAKEVGMKMREMI